MSLSVVAVSLLISIVAPFLSLFALSLARSMRREITITSASGSSVTLRVKVGCSEHMVAEQIKGAIHDSFFITLDSVSGDSTREYKKNFSFSSPALSVNFATSDIHAFQKVRDIKSNSERYVHVHKGTKTHSELSDLSSRPVWGVKSSQASLMCAS